MLRMSTVRVAFGPDEVLHGVDLEVHKGEILCLLGPSGCGKTTLLRAIAGLETLVDGTIMFDGTRIDTMAVHDRGFGLMFQEFALFPHMSVGENVRFGLRMHGANQQATRVADVLALVGLQSFEQRDVTMLSGGERQRVALARSLAPEPRLLMLDEPLGSLDAALRERLVIDIREIIKRVGLTAIYVTHDQQEAFAIADRVAVMDAGNILQIATPEVIYYRPTTETIARFLGLKNILPLIDWNNGVGLTAVGEFKVPSPSMSILLHPDAITVDKKGDIKARVVERIFTGATYKLRAECQGNVYLQWSTASRGNQAPAVGETILLHVDHDAIVFLE